MIEFGPKIEKSQGVISAAVLLNLGLKSNKSQGIEIETKIEKITRGKSSSFIEFGPKIE